MLWTKHFLCIVHSHCFHKKTILKESISFSNEKRSLSYSCWKGFALISVIWRFLLRWVNCFIDKAPPDCKDKHRNFQINAFYIHLNNHSMKFKIIRLWMLFYCKSFINPYFMYPKLVLLFRLGYCHECSISNVGLRCWRHSGLTF